jgi:hypothetical protein
VNQEAWRTNEGKAERIKERWNEIKPKYLFYALEPLTALPEDYDLAGLCFAGRPPLAGDTLIHMRGAKAGVPAIVLRLRDATVVLTELVIGGQICPLVQASLDGCADFAPSSELCLNFTEAAPPIKTPAVAAVA